MDQNWFTDLFINEAKPAIDRHSGSGASGGDNAPDKYFEGGYAEVNLPNATKIKSYGFYHDSTLEKITMPNVTIIELDAFYDCPKLALTSLPVGLTKLGAYAFHSCKNITLTSIPEKVTEISNQVFTGCTGLTSLTFNSIPTKIANNAFNNCTNLTTINVPWAEGAVANAPWGATKATINYNYKG